MSNGGKNWIPLIAALVIVIVVVAAAVAYVMWPDDENGDDGPLYLHVSFSITTSDVPDPTVKILVDVDGDGTNDQTRTVTPTLTSFGPYYKSMLQTIVVQLDETAQMFTFTIEVYNGTEKLFYSSDEIRTGPMVAGSSDTWNFTPSLVSGNCWLLENYLVTPLNENLEMPD